MPCEYPKDALIEAAASGAEPQGELRAHLDACSSCRAAFAQEQSLFAFIDAGLRTTANSEVPVSLLPRVRARLVEEGMPRRMWTQSLIFAAASVALAFVILLFPRLHPSRSDHQAKQTPQVALSGTPVTNARQHNSGPGTQTVSSNLSHSHSPRHSTLLRRVASSQPEVLVPPDEREAFSRFVFTVQQRSDVAAAFLASIPKKQDALVTLKPLHIADLEMNPLEGRETGMSGSLGEQR